MAENTKVGAMISKANMAKMQSAHDALSDLGVMCGGKESKSVTFSLKSFKQYEMTGAEYAVHECWDIQQCCSVISQVSMMCQGEINEGEMDEAMFLCDVCMSLIEHCKGECQETIDSINKAKSESYTGKSVARSRVIHDYFIEGDKLNLSYAKSIVATLPESMAVKFVAPNQIKGYTFLWGSPELTDIEIEYFTKGTNFWDKVLSINPRPLTWDHAQDKDFKASPIIGEITDFGDDELGRWYTAKLDTAHQYNKAITKLINKGVLGTSSDSAPQYVVREQTGKSTWLKEWPWFASALTNTPAEPRMIGSLEFLKSLGVTLPDVDATRQRYEHKKRQAQVLKLKLER